MLLYLHEEAQKDFLERTLRLLLGKPLIQYSIELALQTSGIDKVFVSTDDNDIAKISRSRRRYCY